MLRRAAAQEAPAAKPWAPPEGWYLEGGGYDRHWDGTWWTDETRPSTSESQPLPGPPPPPTAESVVVQEESPKHPGKAVPGQMGPVPAPDTKRERRQRRDAEPQPVPRHKELSGEDVAYGAFVGVGALFGIILGLIFATLAAILFSVFLVVAVLGILALMGSDPHPAALIALVVIPPYLIGKVTSSYAISPQPKEAGHVGILIGMAAGVVIPTLMFGGLIWAIAGGALSGTVPGGNSDGLDSFLGSGSAMLLIPWLALLSLGAARTGLKESKSLARQRRGR